MTTFDDRVQAYEAKYAQDEKMQFRARMRRDRFLAVWASGLRGDTVEAARSFAQTVIHEDLQHMGDEDVMRVAMEYLGDLSNEATIRAKLEEFMREAKDQIEQGI